MKIFTTAILVILTLNASFAQTKLGIKITPSLLAQRVTNPFDSIGIKADGSSACLPMLAFAEISIGRNYRISTGIGYLSRRMLFDEFSNQEMIDNNIDLRVQYLQIPLTLKLYTDEIALDKRLYFQFGPVVEFKLHEKTEAGEIPEYVVPAGGHFSLLLAAGVDILLSPNTAVQVGINYCRGLSNIFEYNGVNEDIPDVRSDLFGIDLIVKF